MFVHINSGIKSGFLFSTKDNRGNSNKLKSFQSYGKNVPFNAEVQKKCTSSKNLDDYEVNNGSVLYCH